MMKFGTITQQGLTLSSDIGILPAQHSANIQIDFSADPAYSGFVATAQIAYPTCDLVYLNVSVPVADGTIIIPKECFQQNGTMIISIGFSKENEFIVTHPLSLIVVDAPGSSVVLPPEDIWQQQVAAFVQSYLSTEGITITATAETGAPGTEATVENTGTGTNPVFKFTIPRGNPGQNGSDGAAATIQVGTVTTSEAGGEASVTNIGSSTAAVFNFVIPRGQTGPAGAGVPEGGTAGQIIVSTGNGGTEWQDMPKTDVTIDASGGLQNTESGLSIKRNAGASDGSGLNISVDGLIVELATGGRRGAIIGANRLNNQTEPVGIGADGKLYTKPIDKGVTIDPAGGLQETETGLAIKTNESVSNGSGITKTEDGFYVKIAGGGNRGGFIGVNKTETQTELVGTGSDGKIYTKPIPTVDSQLSTASTNPVQNKVIAAAIGDISTALNAILGV